MIKIKVVYRNPNAGRKYRRKIARLIGRSAAAVAANVVVVCVVFPVVVVAVTNPPAQSLIALATVSFPHCLF